MPGATHTYDESGDYFPTLRVTDDRGAADTDFTQVSVKSPPVARLDFHGVTDIYKHLLWDASGSTDADGEVVKYEWDFDGDGVYEYDASTTGETASQQALQDFYYYASGDYPVGVRVTDDDGLSATASKLATLVVSMTWHMTQADERMDAASVAGIEPYPDLLDVAGHPTLLYSRRLDEDDPTTLSSIGCAYLRANDTFGTDWPAPVIIFGSRVTDAAIVNGNPAFISSYWIGESPTTADVYELIIRAFNTTGSSWLEPVLLNHYRLDAGEVVEGVRLIYGNDGYLLNVEGRPALVGFDGVYPPGAYTRSLDIKGQSWSEPYIHGANARSGKDAIITVQGLPAKVSCVNDKDIVYQRAIDATAMEWSTAVLAEESETVNGTPALLDIEGTPAVIYYDSTTESLRYRLATDANGSTWFAPRTLTNRSTGAMAAALIDGRPFVMYKDRIGDELYVIAANDPHGASWTLPAPVPVLDAIFIDEFGYSHAKFVDIAGCPAGVYRQGFGTAGNLGERLLYISYY